MPLSAKGKNLLYYLAKRFEDYESTANMSRIVLFERIDTVPHIIILRPKDGSGKGIIAYLSTDPNIGIVE